MQCPYCEADNQSRVVDTTPTAQGGIRRRRECLVCGRRFSTFERVLRATPMLVKSNGDREPFDRDKLIHGVRVACGKRPVPAAEINNLVDEIETRLQNMGKDEVSSRVVGDMLIEGLKQLDPIAYIRYAIVYLGLDSITSVRDMLDGLLADQNARTSHGAGTHQPQPRAPADRAVPVLGSDGSESGLSRGKEGSGPESSKD